MNFDLHKVIWAVVALSVVWFGAAMFKPAHALENQLTISGGSTHFDGKSGTYANLDARYSILEGRVSVINDQEFLINNNELDVDHTDIAVGLVVPLGKTTGISVGVKEEEFEVNNFNIDDTTPYIAGIYDNGTLEGRIQFADESDVADFSTEISGRLNVVGGLGIEGSVYTDDNFDEDSNFYTVGLSYQF